MILLRMAALAASVCILATSTACRNPTPADPSWADRPLPAESRAIDQDMADAGADLFAGRCSACHYLGGEDPEAGLGPNLAGVTERRDIEWIRAMISHPDSMLEADTTAARLYGEYGVRMLNVGADDAEVRALLEFLWRADRGGPEPGAGG